jgi:hypothetical protein
MIQVLFFVEHVMNKRFLARYAKYLLIAIFIQMLTPAAGQTTTYMTIPSGSFIVNMGVTPQTINNGLKPYGLLYALLQANCPVHWVINPDKTKDGIDFSHAGTDYRGAPFIIEAKYRTAAVNTILAQWVGSSVVPGYGNYPGQGVIGTTNTSPIPNVPVYLTFTWVPSWVMDKQNGSIAVPYFANAGIPATAHGGSNSNQWVLPADLTCCHDIFVMPHADPVWSTHQRLISWNLDCKGALWNACHSPSALENIVDNITPDRDVQANFLTVKDPAWKGATGVWTQSNSLILWGSHADGTPPYTFNNTYASDPIAQYMGTIDASTQNGSEQIYMPRQGTLSTNPSLYETGAVARWRPETRILVYDPTQFNVTTVNPDLSNVAAVMVYGRGYGDPERGLVMHQAGHSHAKATAPANVAAQRAFFNFGFYTMWERTIKPVVTIPPVIFADTANIVMSYQLQYKNGTPYTGTSVSTAVWSSSCGGSFNTASSNPTLFTPQAVQGDVQCSFTVLITDNCGRISFETQVATIKCRFDVTTSIVNPCFENPTGGSISMTPLFGVPGYAWSYSKDGGAPVTGTGLIISNLTPGTYVVTVSDRDGSGCPKTFTVTLNTSPEIIVTATPVHVSCNGGSNGAINVSVSGGTPGFTYAWSDGPVTTQNRSGLTSGSYTVTVTDSKGCSKATTVTVSQPTAIVITPAVTDVTCYGFNNGIINLAVSGGTPGYTYLWSDGNPSQNRTGLAPGTYSVTVTDANNCMQVLSGIQVAQPSAALNLSETHVNVTCFGGSTGSINLTVSGGTPFTTGDPYQYAWTKTGSSYNASSEDISSLTAGIYNVTVTDAKGCVASLSVTITQAPAMTLSSSVAHPTCPPVAPQNYSDGTISITVTNGTPLYLFSWAGPNSYSFQSSGQGNQNTISGLIAGTYNVTVTDANGCTQSASVTLNYLNPVLPPPGSITQ